MIEKDRYIRQLVLPEIGEKGQERLKDSKVLKFCWALES